MSSLTIYLSLTSSPSAPRIPLTLPPNTTSSQLRALASAATNIPLATMKLIFRGRMIPDKAEGDVVTEFKLEEECVIHAMGKPVVADGSSQQPQPQQARPAIAGASVTLPAAAPASGTTPGLTAALATLRSTNSPVTYRTALSTASKLLNNIMEHPMEEKYRSVKQSNAAFHKRLGGVNGGEALLLAAGFSLEDGVFVLRPSEEAWPKLVEAGEVVGRALMEVEANAAPVSGAGVSSGLGVGGGASQPSMGGLPNFDSMGGPGMEAAMQNVLSNPDMLQNMMNNPMVQQMMRNDPRFANNPMLQQSLDALSSNPDMIRQFSQMMGDPGVRANVTRMMQQQQQQQAGGNTAGGDPFANGPEAMRRQMEQFQQMSRQFGGMSGGFGASSAQGAPSGQPGGSVGGNSNTTNANGDGDDSHMTEEEMIAEAIARSLRES